MRTTGRPRPAPFRALKVRNYRLFFIGQVLSVIGTWTQNTAIAWIVLRGGSSDFNDNLVRVACRYRDLADRWIDYYGFRCVRSQ